VGGAFICYGAAGPGCIPFNPCQISPVCGDGVTAYFGIRQFVRSCNFRIWRHFCIHLLITSGALDRVFCYSTADMLLVEKYSSKLSGWIPDIFNIRFEISL
jgi:hypothetical protein